VVVDDYRIIPAALEEADRIDPTECRRYVEERFAPERMVADYVRAFRTAIDRAGELEAVSEDVPRLLGRPATTFAEAVRACL
jgi:hypothetical protein